MKKTLMLEQIRIDGNTQTRCKIDDTLVASYCEQFKADPDQMPEVDVYYDGVDYWLADGFHRYHAVTRSGLKYIGCRIHKGDKTEALRHAIGANAVHGARRTSADLEKCVRMAWENREALGIGDNPSARSLAVLAKCSNVYVSSIIGKIRPQLLTTNNCPPPPPSPVKGRDGKTYSATPKKKGPPPSPVKKQDQELRDDAGRKIPVKVFPHLAEMWENKFMPDKIMQDISAVRSFLRAIEKNSDPVFTGVRFDEVQTHLDAVYDAMKDCIPYVVCGVCNGQGCKCCHGGFMSKGQWTHFVTEEQRELILRGEK